MAGLIDAIVANIDDTNRKKKVVDLSSPKEFSAEEIKGIREKSGMDVDAFADYIGVSASAVNAWESGEKKPGASAMQIIVMIANENKEA